jgi:hypothetical protein
VPEWARPVEKVLLMNRIADVHVEPPRRTQRPNHDVSKFFLKTRQRLQPFVNHLRGLVAWLVQLAFA